MARLADNPLSNNALKKLRKLVVDDRDESCLRLKMLNLDERSTSSKRDVAWCSQRFSEATNSKRITFGGIPIVNCQLVIKTYMLAY